jgi:hypothetical protein
MGAILGNQCRAPFDHGTQLTFQRGVQAQFLAEEDRHGFVFQGHRFAGKMHQFGRLVGVVHLEAVVVLVPETKRRAQPGVDAVADEPDQQRQNGYELDFTQ